MTDRIMSYIKDIQVKDANNSGSFVLDKSIIDNVFLKDFKKAFVYKKAEKLSHAVHVVLAHTGELQGVTDRIGLLSTEIIADVLRADRVRVSAASLELCSLLRVGETAGVFASKNVELLTKEYTYLLASIFEPANESVSIDTSVEELFQEEKNTPAARSATVATEKNASKGQKDRKGQIVDILKDKGPSGIKDISSVIREYSEKTIQRELNNLISEGLVVKEGERRWSTYRLVS